MSTNGISDLKARIAEIKKEMKKLQEELAGLEAIVFFKEKPKA